MKTNGKKWFENVECAWVFRYLQSLVGLYTFSIFCYRVFVPKAREKILMFKLPDTFILSGNFKSPAASWESLQLMAIFSYWSALFLICGTILRPQKEVLWNAGMTALDVPPFLPPALFCLKTLCPLSSYTSHLSQLEGYLMVIILNLLWTEWLDD